jgi:hypothetical protein
MMKDLFDTHLRIASDFGGIHVLSEIHELSEQQQQQQSLMACRPPVDYENGGSPVRGREGILKLSGSARNDLRNGGESPDE